jgi:hypothetical protein
VTQFGLLGDRLPDAGLFSQNNLATFPQSDNAPAERWFDFHVALMRHPVDA